MSWNDARANLLYVKGLQGCRWYSYVYHSKIYCNVCLRAHMSHYRLLLQAGTNGAVTLQLLLGTRGEKSSVSIHCCSQ